MESILAAFLVTTVLTGLFVFAGERLGILSSDRFLSPAFRWAAYGWFALLVFIITLLVVQSSRATGSVDVTALSFWSLFTMHVLLTVFLVVWWLLAGQPPVQQFLNLRMEHPMQSAAIGIIVGVGGWVVTLTIALGLGLALTQAGLMPEDVKPSPIIPWMAALPLWQKALIVFSAMTVEEAFFRGWLQKRVGLLLSTALFAVSHAGYGQPFLLVGVTVVSLIIGYTFYRTKDLWPCIIAHGVFDAIQLFVIVPLVLQMAGQGG